MPLSKSKDVGTNIKELRTGNTYKKTKRKFGKARAEKQALAIALRHSGKSRKPTKNEKKFVGGL